MTFDTKASFVSLNTCRLLARMTTDGGRPGKMVPVNWHPRDSSLLPNYRNGGSPVQRWRRANANKVKFFCINRTNNLNEK